jgi:hypothetical protein
MSRRGDAGNFEIGEEMLEILKVFIFVSNLAHFR